MKNGFANNKYLHLLGLVFCVGALAATVALICLHFINLPKAPYYTDEVLTIFPSRGILEHGVPVYPTGMLYTTSLLNNYLVALSMSVFGDNPIGFRLPSFTFSILCLFFTYLLSRRFLPRHLSIIAVLLLALSQFETNFALSARMYIQLQFFSLLFLYTFHRGIEENTAKLKWMASVVLILGLYTNPLILFLVPPVLLHVVIKHKGWRRDKHLLASLSVALAAFLALLFLPNFFSAKEDWMEAGLTRVAGISFNNIFWYLKLFALEFPLGSAFVLFTVLTAVYEKAVRRKAEFLILTYFIPLLSIAIVAQYRADRYISLILPVCIIFAVFGAETWRRFLFHHGAGDKLSWRILSIIIVAFFLFVPGYVYKVGTKSNRHDYSQAFEYLKKHSLKSDIITSQNTPLTIMYVGRCDYVIAQRYSDGKFSEFDYERDARFGTLILDSLPEIQNIFENHDKIWFVDTLYRQGDPLINGDVFVVSYLERKLKLSFIDPVNYTAVYLYEK